MKKDILDKDPCKDWTIVSSVNGKSKDGFPIGKILCRYKEDIQSVIEDHNIENPMTTSYKEFNEYE